MPFWFLVLPPGNLSEAGRGSSYQFANWCIWLILNCSWLLLHLLVLFFLISNLQRLSRVLFLDHPVEDEVVFISHAVEEIFEELSKVANVRLLFEFKASAVVHVDGELLWITFSQSLNRCWELLVSYFFVLLFLGLSREPLPGKRPATEVHEDKPKRLKVISSRLF